MNRNKLKTVIQNNTFYMLYEIFSMSYVVFSMVFTIRIDSVDRTETK